MVLNREEFVSAGTLLTVIDDTMVEDYLQRGDLVEVSSDTWGTFIGLVGIGDGMCMFSRRRFERYNGVNPKEPGPIDDTEVKTIWY